MHWYQNMSKTPRHALLLAPTTLYVDHGRGPLHARWGWSALHSRKAVNTAVIGQLLVAVHGHALTVPAELAVGGWRDGARRVTPDSGALLEGKQLLGTEGLVVDLGGGLDEILEVGACEEVAEVDELAVVLVLDWEELALSMSGRISPGHTVNNTPLGLATADVLAVDNDCLLRANDCKGDEIL
jgi:hypothetical protein